VLGSVPVSDMVPCSLTFVMEPLLRRQFESVRVDAMRSGKVAGICEARVWGIMLQSSSLRVILAAGNR